MELKYTEGCTSYYLEIDGKDSEDYSEDELISICTKLVNKLPKQDIINTIENLLFILGSYTYEYTCSQCGDSVGNYTLNLD